MNNELGTFIGQSKTRLVRGRAKYRVRNTWPPSCEDPASERWVQENYPREFTQLEELYNEFCKKAHSLILSNMGGPLMPHQVIFPDFYYDVIPDKFPVE